MASQRWRAAMEYHVGLEVSLKQTSICVVDQSGSVVREGVVDSDPEAIAVYVRSKAPGAVRIGLETGPTSTWLWTELKRLGLPVICIDARHAKAGLKMQINNSDRNRQGYRQPLRFRNRPEATVGRQAYHYNVFWNSFANVLSSFSLRSEIAQYALSPFLQLTILNPLAGPVETGRASPLGKEMAVRLMMWRRRL